MKRRRTLIKRWFENHYKVAVSIVIFMFLSNLISFLYSFHYADSSSLFSHFSIFLLFILILLKFNKNKNNLKSILEFCSFWTLACSILILFLTNFSNLETYIIPLNIILSYILMMIIIPKLNFEKSWA